MRMRIYQACERTFGWDVIPVASASVEGLDHKVTVSSWGYLCDCDGYRFRGKCRHEAEARQKRCLWNEILYPEAPQDDFERAEGQCPFCGGPTVTVAMLEDDEDE